MALPEQKRRELLFLALFALTYSPSKEEIEPDALIDLLMETLKTTKKNCLIAIQEAKEVIEQVSEADSEVAKLANRFSPEKIPHAEKTILRLAYSEKGKLPLEIIISEALRLAKKFSSKESIPFINALLDAMLKNDRKE